MQETGSNPIVFFDGVCNFCNASVNFIMKRDPRRVFRFAALQSDFAQQFLAGKGLTINDISTIYLWDTEALYDRSTAGLRIARHLRFPWNLLFAFILVPPFIRNGIYDFIARNRYRMMGKREQCRIPTPEERALFLG